MRVLRLLTNGWVMLGMGVAAFIYFTFIESIGLTYENSEMWDSSGQVRTVFKRKEQIFMHRRICKSKDAVGFVDRELMNVKTGAIYPLSRVPSGVFEKCADRTIAIILPIDLPAGDYLFRSKGIYQVNIIRQQIYFAPPIPFSIED